MDTIQDYHRFADRIMDLVSDYLRYGNWTDPDDGIYVDSENEVSLINRKDITDPDNFYPLTTFIVSEDGKELVCVDRIDEVTAKYIFVR